MNCKIGDLAIITRGKIVAGRIIEVMDVCPKNVNFRLPDGTPHVPVNYEWIVRFQNPVPARFSWGDGTVTERQTIWAPVPDRVLRPITGLPIDEETLDEVPAC